MSTPAPTTIAPTPIPTTIAPTPTPTSDPCRRRYHDQNNEMIVLILFIFVIGIVGIVLASDMTSDESSSA